MRFRSPSLAELHAFAAVAELGSFSAAAQALSVTQGAVSRAVQRLETELGLALLARGGAQVRPTPHGADYLARIRPALDMLESAVPLAAATAGPSLRIAPVPSLYARWLVPRLPALQAQHPQLQLEFRRWRHDDGFERDDVDCWINPKPSVHSRWPEGVVAQYLLGRELVAVCRPSRAARLSRPQDVLQHPLLHHSAHPGDWSLWLKAQGVQAARPRLASGFDLAAALIEAVVADMGIAVVQLCLIERELAAGQLVLPFSGWVSSGRGFYLCRRADREASSEQHSFAQWAVAGSRHWRRQALAALD
ncbi:DNA-binding transcriptional LysR family regulator [Pelomonas saccharophila]|uniref:DNA-binding transcriptional LysR family regulator n=1 Tax=Roseateles saccharophilus TaxID=304 RepID=A0ABU1YIP3_ROSSA|nr:LysR substrate-binding domain-containing protein [Roseateles saccharophilus]MDR7268710.1 DNA-binding transcriptional LysR family regulator [Roseateles saccharophilus]